MNAEEGNGKKRNSQAGHCFAPLRMKGSYMPEAAILLPMAFLLTALLLVCTFYVHNRVWYMAGAYEAVLQGNGRIPSGEKAEEIMEEKAGKRAEEQIMPGNSPSISVSSTSSGSQVIYEADYNIWKLSVKARADKVRPVNYLRRLWALQGLTEDFGG